ncbi:hypothetical protein M7I_7031 [Glarea lozoyensis 74030]|uniref:Uncharacterized protein n=1 Tax=Glarea lozoyensis (strain ATCC 74030 / MF5533) TaxID=1104152 RepID=H0EW70_GLAL7|nr:hypothetical protein M7I_7031 [Glarea lozoyensis 74030]
MNDLKTSKLPVQDIPSDDLDPYQAAPQELRDVWKSWTKTKAPFPEVKQKLQPAQTTIPEGLLVEEFVTFVLEHLFTLFRNDPRGLESFIDKCDPHEDGQALSMENAVPSGIPDQKSFSKEAFMHYARSTAF